MLRRNTRRKRSRTRTRGTELTVENVIDIWKSETFQKEHGESKEKIEKIINKWKNYKDGDNSKQIVNDNEDEQTLAPKINNSQGVSSVQVEHEGHIEENDDIDCIKYKCDHCEYATRSKSEVKRHMMENHL